MESEGDLGKNFDTGVEGTEARPDTKIKGCQRKLRCFRWPTPHSPLHPSMKSLLYLSLLSRDVFAALGWGLGGVGVQIKRRNLVFMLQEF